MLGEAKLRMKQQQATTTTTSGDIDDNNDDGFVHPFAGRGIIFVTGRQGAGKSVVANGLAAKHGFAHLDGDEWSCREDVKDTRTALCECMVKYRDRDSDGTDGRSGVVDDDEENAAASSWRPFYVAMCAEAIKMSNDVSPEGGVVLVSHSLYRRSQRAFVAKQLGATRCLFLVVAPPPEVALRRAAERSAEQYKAMGKTVEEWAGMLEVNSAGFQEYDPEAEEEVANALVLVNDDGTTVADLLSTAENLLGLSQVAGRAMNSSY